MARDLQIPILYIQMRADDPSYYPGVKLKADGLFWEHGDVLSEENQFYWEEMMLYADPNEFVDFNRFTWRY